MSDYTLPTKTNCTVCNRPLRKLSACEDRLTLAAFCLEGCQGVQFFHHPGIRYGFWKPRHQSLERYAISEQLILSKSEWVDVQLTDSETQQQIRGPSPPTDN